MVPEFRNAAPYPLIPYGDTNDGKDAGGIFYAVL